MFRIIIFMLFIFIALSMTGCFSRYAWDLVGCKTDASACQVLTPYKELTACLGDAKNLNRNGARIKYGCAPRG